MCFRHRIINTGPVCSIDSPSTNAFLFKLPSPHCLTQAHLKVKLLEFGSHAFSLGSMIHMFKYMVPFAASMFEDPVLCACYPIFNSFCFPGFHFLPPLFLFLYSKFQVNLGKPSLMPCIPLSGYSSNLLFFLKSTHWFSLSPARIIMNTLKYLGHPWKLACYQRPKWGTPKKQISQLLDSKFFLILEVVNCVLCGFCSSLNIF